MSGDEALEDKRLAESLQGQLTQVREQNRRSQIDSIHVLAALGIIGWYFTTQRDSLTTFSNTFEIYFFAFTLLSAGYIVLKINLASVHDVTQRPGVAKIERGVSFLFFASFDGLVLGALVNTVLVWIGIDQPRPSVLLATAVAAIVVSSLPAFYYYETSLEIDQTVQKQELVDLVFKNPNLLENGFQPKERDWVNRTEGWLQRADIYGIDDEGDKVIVDITPYATKQDIETLTRNANINSDIRFILAAPKFSDTADKLLRESDNLEHRVLKVGNQSQFWSFINTITE
jgi:hypothetical protein